MECHGFNGKGSAIQGQKRKQTDVLDAWKAQQQAHHEIFDGIAWQRAFIQ